VERASYRPVFVGSIVLADQFPGALLFALWLMGIVVLMTFLFIGLPMSLLSGALIGFSSSLAWSYISTKDRYRGMTYYIDEDRVTREIREGDAVVDHLSVHLADVRLIRMHQSARQEAHGVGTIMLLKKHTFLDALFGQYKSGGRWLASPAVPYRLALFYGSVPMSKDIGAVLLRDVRGADLLYRQLTTRKQELDSSSADIELGPWSRESRPFRPA
jgi:hypothetical protein